MKWAKICRMLTGPALRRIGAAAAQYVGEHDLRSEPEQLEQLALLLGYGNAIRLREECLACMAANRSAFDELFP